MAPVVRAAQVVLDRTGFHPSLTVQVQQQATIAAWAAYLTDEQLATVQTWIAEAKARLAAGEPTPPRQPLLPDDDDEDLDAGSDGETLVRV